MSEGNPMHTNSINDGALKPEGKPTGGSASWQNFLALVSDRRFLAVPIVTWAILQLSLVFGGHDVKNVIEFITH
jgi:hypothetical protein